MRSERSIFGATRSCGPDVMRYVSFKVDGRSSFGAVVGEGLCDLGARTGLPDLRTFLQSERAGAAIAQVADIFVGEFSYLPVVPDARKILCVGLNYETHRKETGRAEAAHPAIFTRFADSLVGHGQPILKPEISDKFDYEGELAVIIGRPGFRIAEADAMSHVAGYSCFNDGTVRDWQRHTHQFTPGKNFRCSGGFGPELVTPDEVNSFADQAIETWVNGALVQSAVLGDMIFGIPQVIAYVSAFTPLATGDVIAMGTPGGVGFKRTPPQFLKSGDRVEVSIGAVGTLANTVEDERP